MIDNNIDVFNKNHSNNGSFMQTMAIKQWICEMLIQAMAKTMVHSNDIPIMVHLNEVHSNKGSSKEGISQGIALTMIQAKIFKEYF
jgi:hypothetical protein